MLEDAEREPGRWIDLIQRLDDIPPPSRAETLARIEAIGAEDLIGDQERAAIWDALREKVARHREFATAKWALSEADIAVIEKTAATFEPSAALLRRGWLFKTYRPDIPDIARGGNLREYDVALKTLRSEAAADIARENSWEAVLGFAVGLEAPWFLGEALADATRHEYEGEFLGLLESGDDAESAFASGYVWQRFRDSGWDWIEGHRAAGDLSPSQLGRLLVHTHDFPRAWEVAEAEGEAVSQVFWTGFRTHGLGGEFSHVDFVASRLIGVGRLASALDFIALYSNLHEQSPALSKERAELTTRALKAMLEADTVANELRTLGQHQLVSLFGALESSDVAEEEVAGLEWAYLPAFGIDSRPVALNNMLSRDPGFFVSLIERMYRSSDDEDTKDAELEATKPGDADERAAFAANAYRLLSEWRSVPGTFEDGSVDRAALEAWVIDVRSALSESEHLDVADAHIGHVLAYGPPDADGTRPCEPIRALLETLQSEALEDGLRVELYNSRGSTSRGVFDGGNRERALAASYAAQAQDLADRWPRSATVLRRLAESYEREALRMDEEAERRRKGFES
jgi:hypothetical protein